MEADCGYVDSPRRASTSVFHKILLERKYQEEIRKGGGPRHKRSRAKSEVAGTGQVKLHFSISDDFIVA